MEYRNLGGSGCAASAFALGTMTFGDNTDEATAFAQLDAFAENGGTLVDTADVYVDGASESTPSTSTKFIRGTPSPPSRRPFPSSMTRDAPARSATAGFPTTSVGRSRRPWTQRNSRGSLDR